MKNVTIISSSLRNGSNSELMAKEVEKALKENGNNVEFISLKNKEIKYCIGCLSCQKTQKCVLKDSVFEILEKVRDCDILIFASPIYYYEMAGQLKTLIDRLNPLYTQENKFKDVYALFSAAEDENYTPLKAVEGIKGFVDCYPQATFKDYLFIGDLNDGNDVKNNNRLERAYNFGKNIK